MRAQWVCSRERRIALYKRSSIINQSILRMQWVVRDKFSQYFISVFAGSAVYNCVCVSFRFASGKGLTMLERDRRSTEDPPAMPFPPRSRPDYLQCDGVRHHGVCFSILPLQFTWAYFSHRPCSSVKADLVLHLCVCVCACVCERDRQTDREQSEVCVCVCF